VAKKGQKKPNFIWPFFKNNERPKELKKGKKLQIWPQKSPTGNPAWTQGGCTRQSLFFLAYLLSSSNVKCVEFSVSAFK